MKKEEAMKLIMDKYPNHTVDKVTETGKYFLISISRKGAFENSFFKPVMFDDGLKAVDKTNGQIFTYNPILHK